MSSTLKKTIGHGIPITVVLKWPRPNYVNPETRSWFPAFALTLQVFTTIVVFARVYTRLRGQAGKFGLDDWLIIPGWIFSIVTTIAFTVGAVRYGYDRHIWDNRLGNSVGAGFIGWLTGSTFIWATCLTKISILLFYRRMGAGTYNRTWKWATWGCIIFTASFLIAFQTAHIFSCWPTESYWMSYSLSYTTPYKCKGEYAVGLLTGVFGVVTDVIAVLMPALLFWNLMMPKKEKIALWSIFALGILTVGAGIGRTVGLHRLLSGAGNFDATWYAFDTFVFSVLEMNLALFCASAPTLKCFFNRHIRTPSSWYASKRSKGSSNNSKSPAPFVVRVDKEFSQTVSTYADNDSVFDLKENTQAATEAIKTPLLPWEEPKTPPPQKGSFRSHVLSYLPSVAERLGLKKPDTESESQPRRYTAWSQTTTNLTALPPTRTASPYSPYADSMRSGNAFASMPSLPIASSMIGTPPPYESTSNLVRTKSSDALNGLTMNPISRPGTAKSSASSASGKSKKSKISFKHARYIPTRPSYPSSPPPPMPVLSRPTTAGSQFTSTSSISALTSTTTTQAPFPFPAPPIPTSQPSSPGTMYSRYQAGQFGPPTPPKDLRVSWPSRTSQHSSLSGAGSIHSRRASRHQRMHSDQTIVTKSMSEREKREKRSTMQRELAWYAKASRRGFSMKSPGVREEERDGEGEIQTGLIEMVLEREKSMGKGKGKVVVVSASADGRVSPDSKPEVPLPLVVKGR